MTPRKGEDFKIRPHEDLLLHFIEEPQKRGAKGHFAGSRHKFLTGYLNEYIALRGKSRIQFWHKLYNAWWEKYPWRLPDSEEPPTDNPERMKELARVETDADAERKSEVENALRDVSPRQSFSLKK